MNARIARACLSGVLAVGAPLLFGCAVVKINKDATDSVEHSGGEDVGKDLANRACHKAGAVRAEIISTAKKDDSNPESRSVTTFRCLY